MYFSPSWRRKKYPFLKDNEAWWIVLVLDLLAIPLSLIANKFEKYINIAAPNQPRLNFMTPNSISLASFVMFYLGISILFVYPDKNLAYTACFFTSVLLDAVDGKLARISGTKSSFGAIVDAFFDMLNHSLGLVLIGLALSSRTNDLYPLLVLLPYTIFLGGIHINQITEVVTGHSSKHQKNIITNNPKTKWQVFCDKRGLGYNIYNDIEVIDVSILLIAVNLKNPTLFLFLSIYLSFIPRIWNEHMKTIRYGLLGKK